MATPVDFRYLGPLAEDVFGVGGLDVADVLDADGNVPPQVVLQGFRTLKPTSQVTRYVDLWERLWDDGYVAAYQAMTAWSDDHVPFPGAAAEETVRMLVLMPLQLPPADRRRRPRAPRRRPLPVPHRARQT